MYVYGFQSVRKLNTPNSVTFLNQTPIFEWYVVVRFGSNDICQKGMCIKEIGLCVQTMITIMIL